MITKAKKLVDHSELVSFDIFDTLVNRMCETPADVFSLVAQQHALPAEKFKNDRIVAEKNARANNHDGEIYLQDIYGHLEKWYPNAFEIMETEIEMECSICYPNEEMVDLFHYACQNKTVILTSDMYLSEAVIEKILKNCSISGYKKLFLSSTLKLTKHNGDLFDHIIECYHIEPEKMLHIGDNIKSDYIVPKTKAIKSFRYVPKKKKLDEFCVPMLDVFIAKNLRSKDKSFYYSFGKNVLGPAVYGYVSWIKDFLQKQNIKKVFFFAREGEFIKRAFDCIVDNPFEEHYLYVSRRSLTVPAIATIKDIDSFLKYRPIREKVKVRDQIGKLGLTTNDFLDCHWYCADSLDKTFSELKEEEKSEIIEDMFHRVQRKAKAELMLLKFYFSQENVNGKFAVVDLGWNGSMQSAMVDVLADTFEDADMVGFFLAQRDEYYKYKDKIKNFGYLFNYGDVSDEENLLLNSGTSLLEFLFSASHGSTIGYEKKGENVYPILDEYEFKEVYPIIKECQEGAIDFIKDYSKNFSENVSIEYKQYFFPMYRVLQQPSYELIEHFGDICVSDMNETEVYLANKCSLTSPKKFIKAFTECGWKTAFIKRNLRTKHALAIYSVLRKHFN